MNYQPWKDMEKIWMHIAEWKKPALKKLHTIGFQLYWPSGNGKPIERVKRSVVAQGGGGWGINRQSTEDFQGCENTQYDSIMVDTCHYTVIQIHRTYETHSPKVNDGLWVLMMCPCRFVFGNKWPCMDRGRGYMGNLCIFPSIMM